MRELVTSKLSKFIWASCWEVKRLKSSPYGPYVLGYTRVTMVETESNYS